MFLVYSYLFMNYMTHKLFNIFETDLTKKMQQIASEDTTVGHLHF